MNRPKFPTPESIPDNVRDWMERMLIALGQMKHPPRDCNAEGMLLDVEQRRDLIHEGVSLLGYPGFPVAKEMARKVDYETRKRYGAIRIMTIDELKALSREQLLSVIEEAKKNSSLVSERITGARVSGDTNPVECDFYSSLTESYYGDHHGCRLVERKRIGLKGLRDMHWIGFIDPSNAKSWRPEGKEIGVWLIS